MCFISTRIPLQTSGDAVSMVLENPKSGGTAHRRQVSKHTLNFYENIVFQPRLSILSFMLILAFLVNILSLVKEYKVENADTTPDFDGVEANLEPDCRQ